MIVSSCLYFFILKYQFDRPGGDVEVVVFVLQEDEGRAVGRHLGGEGAPAVGEVDEALKIRKLLLFP